MSFQNEEKEGVKFNVREADDTQRKDAEGIARTFQAVYEDYPFTSYTDPSVVQQEVIPGDDIVLVVDIEPGQEVNGEEIEQSKIIGTGAVKPQREGRLAELGSAALHPDFQGLEGSDIYQRVLDERIKKANQEADADILYTQPVSGLHAITQWEHYKRDFSTAGVSKNKYPEVFAGEGRETVVPMVDANSDFQYVKGTLKKDGDPKLYFPKKENRDGRSLENLVDHVLGGINEKREGSRVRRNSIIVEPEVSEEEQNEYVVREKVDDTGISQMAAYEVLPASKAKAGEEAVSLLDVRRKLRSKTRKDKYKWVGVELDANEPVSVPLLESLVNSGYEPEKFMPEKLYDDDVGDVIGLQYTEDGTGRIEMIDEAVDAARRAGMDIDTADDTGLEHTQYAYL